MSIYSARKHLKTMDTTARFCFPLSLDAIMPTAELPDHYYEQFGQLAGVVEEDDASYNALLQDLVGNFFKCKSTVDASKEIVGGFNAFTASPQPYFDDVPYQYDISGYVLPMTQKVERLYTLLEKAAKERCNILFSAPAAEGAYHVAGLQTVDFNPAKFIIREPTRGFDPIADRVYSSDDLCGLSKLNGDYTDDYAPLPEFSQPFYPSKQTSWELIVLPPEPRD